MGCKVVSYKKDKRLATRVVWKCEDESRIWSVLLAGLWDLLHCSSQAGGTDWMVPNLRLDNCV